MVYTTKSKKAPGPNNVVTPPAGGAKAEANVTSLDAEGRKGFGFYYDDEVRRTDTPAYIRTLAPYIDAFNWAVSFLMYPLPPLCKWGERLLGVGGSGSCSCYFRPSHPQATSRLIDQ